MKSWIKIIVLILFCIFSFGADAQEIFKLKGVVIGEDAQLIHNAVVQTSKSVVFTNENGEFEIQCKGIILIKISAVGFESFYDNLNIKKDIELVFTLQRISHEIDQVVIEEEGTRYENSKTLNKIESHEIKIIPSAAGVSDIYSTLKTQPGVQSNTEGQKGLIIRGGNYDQSTTYVDGVPVVGSSHLFGLLSMFQTDCIENVKLYNGYKPVKYGTTLGPAIEINLREEFTPQNLNTGSVKSSFLSTQVQTKVSNSNTFYQFGIRKSNLFLIQDLIDDAVNNNDSKVISPVYSFDDVSFKASHLFKNQKLQFLYLRSFDGVDFNIDFVGEERNYLNAMSWNNEATALNWSYYTDGGGVLYSELVSNQYNSALFSNHRITFWDTDLNDQIWRNSLSEFNNTIENLKATISFEKSTKSGVLYNVGLQYKTSEVTPDSYEYWEDEPPTSEDDFTGNTDVETFSGFAEISGEIFSNSSYKLGLRTSRFMYEDEVETHLNPRFLFSHQLTENFGYNFYSLMSSQDVHLVTLNSFGFIPELWVAPTEAKPVERSWCTGLKMNYTGEKTSLFVDAYLRGMSNLLEFSENVDFNQTTSEIVENGITSNGQGAVVGLEFSIKSKHKKFSYNLSYAFGKSSRLFDSLNQGNAFPFAFDIRHDGSLVLAYEINEKFSVSTLYTYSTGRMLNIQNQVVPVGFTTPLGGAYSQWVTYNQPLNRNSYRLGDVHRLDFSITWSKDVEYGVYNFQLGAYNVTNRLNPYSAIVSNDEDGNQTIEEVGMMPILPNLTISLSWD